MPYFTVFFFLVLLLAILYTGMYLSSRRLSIFFLYNALAVLTLGLAPSLAYLVQATLPADRVLQPMPIPSSWYFGYLLPVIVAIGLGSVPWQRKKFMAEDRELVQAIIQYLQKQTFLPFLLLAFGMLMQFCTPLLPGSLRQVGVFSGLVLWVGVLHLFFSPWSWRVKAGVLTLVFIYMVFKALQSTFFGDLFIWPLWFVLYLQTRYHWSKKTLMLTGGTALLLMVFVLLWKFDYRERVFQGENAHYERNFYNTVKNWTENPWNNQRWQQALDRINQGNHLAQVYRWVPTNEPYAHGETFVIAIKASLIPRIFWPDKPQAGGIGIWYRFTGNQLSPNVSMNIGIPGEAYANFGSWLAFVVVLFWVRLLYLLYQGLRLLALRYYPLLWLWVPLIFYPLMDQENDLITMLNHAVKGSFFTLVLCSILFKMGHFWPFKSGKKPI